MKREFRMSDEQYAAMMDAMKRAHNQPVMYLTGGIPMGRDPQEIANEAWKKLGEELGFVWDSASAGSDNHSFMAESTEKPDTHCDSCSISPEGHE